MTKAVTAKLFMNGRSQAVRLPKEFRFEGDQVRIRRLPNGNVVLEPETKPVDVDQWLAELWKHTSKDFMKDGRRQPRAQKRKKMFE